MLVKLEWLGYRMVKKLWRYVKPFSSDTGTLRTDGQTDWQICYINIARQHTALLTRDNEYQLLGWVIIINGNGGCRLWQHVQADLQPKSSGLVLGCWPLDTVLHLSNEPGELLQWLCHDDSAINIVLDTIIIILFFIFIIIIIIIIIRGIIFGRLYCKWCILWLKLDTND